MSNFDIPYYFYDYDDDDDEYSIVFSDSKDLFKLNPQNKPKENDGNVGERNSQA
jgi:hypothetical protein